MSIRPIVSALLRHKTSAALIVLEVAICCAIISNILFLTAIRVERLGRESGLQEDRLVRIEMGTAKQDGNPAMLTLEDIAVLRAIPSVESVTVVNQVPYVKSSWNSPVNLAQVQEEPTLSAAVYLADEAFFHTLGLRIIEGRTFAAGEYLDWATLNAQDSQINIAGAIVTSTLAARLFPGENSVGKMIYTWGDKPVRVIGVVERLMVPDDQGRADVSQYAVVLPVRIPFDMGSYLILTQPERRDEVLAAATVALKHNAADRVLISRAVYSDLRRDFYSEDRSMALVLCIACAFLLLITALGIVGLSSFWVEQRTRQIGVRRALGATRWQILVYFQIENFVLVSAGIMLGMTLAYGINLFLMAHYELPRLPALYLPIGAAVLWLLGQLSVLWPASRAATISPAAATRHF